MSEDLMARVAVLEATIVIRKEMTDTNFEMRDRALRVALEAQDKRLDGMNEFRDTLRDQSGKFITRDEHNSLDIRINRLSTDLAALQARFYLGGTGLVIIITVVQLLLNYVFRSVEIASH